MHDPRAKMGAVRDTGWRWRGSKRGRKRRRKKRVGIAGTAQGLRRDVRWTGLGQAWEPWGPRKTARPLVR